MLSAIRLGSRGDSYYEYLLCVARSYCLELCSHNYQKTIFADGKSQAFLVRTSKLIVEKNMSEPVYQEVYTLSHYFSFVHISSCRGQSRCTWAPWTVCIII